MTTRVHKVEPGESLYSIAHRFGISCWQAIYEHPDNAELRRRRPNPHVLHPGDEVRVPERCPGGAPVPLDRRTVIVRRRRGHQRLRLRLTDGAGAPHASAAYTLTCGALRLEGTTDEQGRLSVEVPSDARDATVAFAGVELALELGQLNPVDADTADGGVSGAQARLNNLGYASGKVDGIIGPITEGALRDFQGDEGLEVTGALDDATREALVRRHGS